MTRIGVLGAAGRMGSTVCRAVIDAPDLELVAAIDPASAGRSIPGLDADSGASFPGVISAGAQALLEAGAEVAIDFTQATAALENLHFCAANGVHAVCGTTGLGADDLAELARLFGRDGEQAAAANCVWAPNFAIGAVLLMHFSEIAARHMDALEVIELHHDGKLDAPSGTAMETARRATAARTAAGGTWPDNPTRREVLPGARGAAGDGGVRVHSVRLPGLVAHQEVIFGGLGQSLTLRHDSYDRVSFMPGVLLAARSVAGRPGLTVGMEALLGL